MTAWALRFTAVVRPKWLGPGLFIGIPFVHNVMID
jgi:hypothetical protein